jgi:hypothetical protein
MLRSALAVMAVVAAFAETIEVARFAIPYFVFLNFSEASVAARLPFGFHLSSSASRYAGLTPLYGQFFATRRFFHEGARVV